MRNDNSGINLYLLKYQTIKCNLGKSQRNEHFQLFDKTGHFGISDDRYKTKKRIFHNATETMAVKILSEMHISYKD